MMHRWAWIWAVTLLLSPGCGDGSEEEETGIAVEFADESDVASTGSNIQSLIEEYDAATIPDAPFDVLVGTGRETYVPIVDGDTMFLELGHQGLQHVLVSIRLLGLPEDRYFVDFQLVRNDGVAVSEPSRVRVPFSEMPDGSGSELLGYTLVVADPELGVGHDGVLRVAVEGPEGNVAMDERAVHVEWAPEGWNPDV